MSSPQLYKFPKLRHKRTEAPGALSKYSDFKPYLISEFSNTCVYCRTPDFLPASEVFGVDHYLPKKHFPKLETTYSNLYFACNTCNRRKGSYFHRSATDPFIPNPCDHVMFDHLRYDGSTAKPHSASGKFAVDQLLLNDPDFITKRETIVACAAAVSIELDSLLKMVARLKKLAAVGNKSAAQKLPDAISDADKIAKRLNRFTGAGHS